MRIYYLLILYVLNSCAIGGSNLSSIDRAEEFFLCFPETDNNYLILPLEKKASIQKEIIKEKGKRKLDCGKFIDLTSAEENLKSINQAEMDRKLGKCRYRNRPCTYD